MKYMCIFIIEIILLKYVTKNINTLTIEEVLNVVNEED